MVELLEKINIFKNSLDESILFKNLDNSLNKININKKLAEKINIYNYTFNEKLRKEIYEYNEIKNYKECETNINLLILEINSKLKIISNERSCKNENN